MERDVKTAVKKYLKEIGAWFIMPVPMIYGKKSIDFLVCYEGMFYGIETKRSAKEKASPMQNITMLGIELAGGKCCVEFDLELPRVKRMFCGTTKKDV